MFLVKPQNLLPLTETFDIRVGDMALLQGLNRMPHLNGSEVRVTEDLGQGNFRVEVSGTNSLYQVKASNLMIAILE
mgnify:CR=1 FL=1